jgi:hypothetical protein
MTTRSETVSKHRNGSGGGGGGATMMTATLWSTTRQDDVDDAVFFTCRGTNKLQCCTNAWNVLNQAIASKNQDEFERECVHQMAIFIEKDFLALFVSSNEGSKRLIVQDEKSVTRKQYTNGEWSSGDAMIHPFASDDANTTTPNMTFSASLDSTLSSSGGMHRLLHHDIQITCPSNMRDGTFYQATLDIVVYVTHHFFVDVDDALLLQSNTTTPFLVSAPKIDIEQPAFGSPQHILNIRVQVEGSCSNAPSHSFATKLHMRYPPLTASGDLHVAFPAPLLLNGMLVIQNELYVLQFHHDTMWQAPIVTHVATGYHQDVMWVPVTTILASLVGSWYILKSMAQVSKWN